MPQTVTVTGVDDAIIDGDVAYTTVLGAASSADPAYEGRDPVDVPVVNVDDDVPPTKFYVVNDASTDRTCEYAATGLSVENYALDGGDTAPRGAASTAAGDKVWVVDANKNAYVYSTSGVLLGSWTAGSLATNATVVGIAINGAASRLSGRPGHSLARHRADPHRRETYEDLAPVLLTPTVASCLALRPRRRPSFAGVLPASPPAC